MWVFPPHDLKLIILSSSFVIFKKPQILTLIKKPLNTSSKDYKKNRSPKWTLLVTRLSSHNEQNVVISRSALYVILIFRVISMCM